MSALYHTEETPQLICWDRTYYPSFEDQLIALKTSRTIYVGNLSFFTTEAQLLETFSVVGPVKRIIMGLNSKSQTPCGFCFIEYYNQEHMKAALKYISGTICDDRIIRCDADGGFIPGRQFGRGKSGGQVRDERKNGIDMSRTLGVIVPQSRPHQSGANYHNNRPTSSYNNRNNNYSNSDRRTYDNTTSSASVLGKHKRGRGDEDGDDDTAIENISKLKVALSTPRY